MSSLRSGLVLVGLWLAAATAQAAIVFSAQLSGAQEVAPNGSTATGSATLVLNDTQTALTYSITVSGIDFTGTQTADTIADNLMAAHIHAAPAGVNGPVIFGFFGAPFNDITPNDVVVTPFTVGVGGTITGKWDAPEGNGGTNLLAQIPNLMLGNTYLNFHTVMFPGGEIRGQILRVPEPGTLALIGFALAGVVFARRRRR
jgi:hypothetical protein